MLEILCVALRHLHTLAKAAAIEPVRPVLLETSVEVLGRGIRSNLLSRTDVLFINSPCTSAVLYIRIGIEKDLIKEID